ncbi:hypothetical protein TWF718_008849 [Orbilia javanica]|uniref:Uncharacterized protein n=1 Tax=Orbilia javanica TaxID=47235 RepID=A0AAN8MQY5_9PEZI
MSYQILAGDSEVVYPLRISDLPGAGAEAQWDQTKSSPAPQRLLSEYRRAKERGLLVPLPEAIDRALQQESQSSTGLRHPWQLPDPGLKALWHPVSEFQAPSMQQTGATVPDRRTRQTNLYLNITATPAPVRSPLGTINANKIRAQNAYREADEPRPESTRPGQVEDFDFLSSPLPRHEFERVDENRRDSISPSQFDHSVFSSSPPAKLDLEGNEELLDESSCNGALFLRSAKELQEKWKDRDGEAPLFWTPEESDTPRRVDTPRAVDTPPNAESIALEFGKKKRGQSNGKRSLPVQETNLDYLPSENTMPEIVLEPLPEKESPQQPQIDSAPKTILLLTDDEVLKFYLTLNFQSTSQWHHIFQLHHVYKMRHVKFDLVSKEDSETWFTPYIADRPTVIRQQWKNCSTIDSHIIRDLHCAFYVALRNILTDVSDIEWEDNISTVSGWMEVCVSPPRLIGQMKEVLQWDEEIVDLLRSEYGIDILHFIDTQYEIKSRSFLREPTIDLTENQNGRGYFLTCKKGKNDKYKLQISPPYIQTQWTIKHGDSGIECTVKPTVWHPHFLFPNRGITPRFSIGKDSQWLYWDRENLCFSGTVPENYQFHEGPSGRSSVGLDIMVEFNHYFMGKRTEGSHLFYRRESITARSYGAIPMKNPSPPVATPTIYSPNPLQLIWNSHKLGFNERHSDFIVGKAREYEAQLYQNRASDDAKDFAVHGLFPWDPKEPRIQSWGRVTWCDFLQQQRSRAEYLRKDPRGRMEMIRDLQKGPRLGPLDLEYGNDEEDVDDDLEEMRRMYENLNHDAHAIVWLHTLYRETMQDRLEDESLDMEQAGLRNREALRFNSKAY